MPDLFGHALSLEARLRPSKWALAVALAGGAFRLAVPAAEAQPRFEVASVKVAGPRVPGATYEMRGGPGTGDPGQITYPRVALKVLMMRAYGVRLDQIQGPDWLLTEMYSVVAKVPPGTTPEQFRLMLQGLLVERFGLRLRHETKDFPTYELVVASGAPGIRPVPPDQDTAPAAPPGALPPLGTDRNGFPVLAPGAQGATLVSGGMVYSTYRMTMAQFAEELAPVVFGATGGPTEPFVVDRTGLGGKFEFTLQFALPLSPMPGADAANAAGPDDPSGGLSLFVAIEKQLGLRLEKGRRSPMDLLVIEHVERVPTAN
jgi:uncharacterized protein (TIGR03435 family)